VLDWDLLTQPPHSDRRRLIRELLAIRGREIVPRLSQGVLDAGFTVLGPRTLEVYWRMGDGARLAVVANLGSASVQVTRMPNEGIIYQNTGRTGAPATGETQMPPWTIVWSVVKDRG
jgi:maltooligosyltrehalose trehalohydrolase